MKDGKKILLPMLLFTMLTITLLMPAVELASSLIVTENPVDVTCGSTPVVDGVISSGEYADADSVSFATSGGTCAVYFKHDGTTLYVAFDVPNLDTESGVQVFVDLDYDQASQPQTDDYRFTISRRSDADEYGENQGTGTGWSPWGPPVGWTGAHQDLASTWNAEFSIPYAKLGITAGLAKTIGIAFCNCWTSTGDHWWPTGGDWMDPSTWGTAYSSDKWLGYNITIAAYCYNEGQYVSVSITIDGTPTGYNTPHTFTGLCGTHTFTVPNTDPYGHPFKQWSTSETSTTITVDTGGTYTAYYEYICPPGNGPRSDLDIRFYGSQEACYAALKAGDVDFIASELTYEQLLDAQADPNLCVAGYSANKIVEFDLNNNYTIATYPGVRNPLHVKEFRCALSCMVDKQHIIDFILKGMAAMLNVPIPANSYSWWPECAYPENFAWAYNLTKAEEQLQLAGFVDTDGNGIRNYPADWPGRPGQPDMDPLIFYVRTEDKRLDAGRYLADQLTLFGIQYTKIEATSDVCFPAVMDDRNYHIYTGQWTVKKYPPLYMFPMFHSDFYFSEGSNYVTGMNESDLPNYPHLDKLLHAMYYTDSIWDALAATLLAAEHGWCNLVVNIPLYSPQSYVAWRKTMAGVVNMFGYGLNNKYTYLNAYNTLGGPIRLGIATAPTTLNPLYCPTNRLAPDTMFSGWQVLDEIIYPHLINENPYDLSILQPWVAQDWEVGTWIDPNPGPGEPSEKTVITFYLRKDCGVVEPGTGTFKRNLNAHDVEFSIWYLYAFDDGWNWHSVMDLHHTSIVDKYTIEVYFDSSSYWFLYAVGEQMPIMPKYELIDELCTISSVSFDGPVPAGTQFKLDNNNEQIVQVTSEDLPVDFHIFGGYEDYEHNWIWILDDLPAGTYTIEYYTPHLDPHGYYLAGLDWTQTWYSAGLFYPIAIEPGVGGYASFNKNPCYFHETPPLGETDWRWIWDTPGGVPGPEVPGRDSGYYQISIYDVVKATASYCHYGYGPYDKQYFPGADLDASDLGHVGIYDVVTITGKYGMKWGRPPPDC